MDAYVTLTGNVGSDLDVFEADEYIYVRFRLASTPRHRREGEWVDGVTTWLGVQTSGRLAKNVRECIRKGDPVLVTGKLRTRTWQSEGMKHDRIILEASSVGHDLNRGVSAFQRRPSKKPVDDAPACDPTTGEILDDPEEEDQAA